MLDFLTRSEARALGGGNRASNLTLACETCNRKKGAQDIRVFLAQAKKPLKDAAAVNATRWVLADALKATGLPVELASGGRTKFNRCRLGIEKTHALDAVCVGAVDKVTHWQKPMLAIQCTGRGSYQRTRLDAYGFPRGYLLRRKDNREKGIARTGTATRSALSLPGLKAEVSRAN